MKNSYILTALLVVLFNTSFSQIVLKPRPVNPCPNGNAENNTYANWSVYTGQSVAQGDPNFILNNDPLKFGIHAHTGPTSNLQIGQSPMIINGNDAYGGFAIPDEGTYCFRIGNNIGAAHAEMMRYSFTVTAANALFKFRYAVVLRDGNHAPNEQAGFSFNLSKGTNLQPQGPFGGFAELAFIASTMNTITVDHNNPFFNVSPNDNSVYYKAWQCYQYDLTPYIGQVITFNARVKGCSLGGHFGYAYIDGLCQAMPATASFTMPTAQYCLEQPIIMNCSASMNEDRYFVEITDNQTGVSVNEWFVDQPAPAVFDLKQFYLNHGKTFICGHSYNVKLAVSSQCAPWNETSQTINIVCPTVDAGVDQTFCCSGEGTTQNITIGENAQVGCTYSWASNPSGQTLPNTSHITVSNSIMQSVAYTVTLTDLKGCIAKDEVLIRRKPRYTIQLTKLPYKECDNRTIVKANLIPIDCPESASFLTLYPQDDASITKWYFKPYNSNIKTFLGTGSSWTAPNTIDGTLYAEYQDQCASSLTTATFPIVYNPENHNHGLIAPNAFTPDNGTYNNIFRILEFGPTAPINIGDGPAYDATDFRLRIWNRWGENFVTIDKAAIGRTGALLQGDIQWDGKLNGVVQDGIYNYTLEMLYCNTTTFEQIKTPNHPETDQCVRWIWAICVEHISGWSSEVTVIQ